LRIQKNPAKSTQIPQYQPVATSICKPAGHKIISNRTEYLNVPEITFTGVSCRRFFLAPVNRSTKNVGTNSLQHPAFSIQPSASSLQHPTPETTRETAIFAHFQLADANWSTPANNPPCSHKTLLQA